jgi:exodeoxyribonuclease-3
VAILARGAAPVVTRRGLPGNPKDLQSRYIEAAVGGVLVGCLYAPNGNPQPGPKFAYKLACSSAGCPCRYVGSRPDPDRARRDFNVVPTMQTSTRQVPGQGRAAAAREPSSFLPGCSRSGWVDAIRTVHPISPLYTFWDYKRDRWRARCRSGRSTISAQLGATVRRLQTAGVDRDVRGREGERPCAGMVGVTRAAVGLRAHQYVKQPGDRVEGPGDRERTNGACV